MMGSEYQQGIHSTLKSPSFNERGVLIFSYRKVSCPAPQGQSSEQQNVLKHHFPKKGLKT